MTLTRDAVSNHILAGRLKYRADIEGLRAIAVVLVLLYHAAPHRLPSGFIGVDIFFVISGFLITTQLVREYERTGRISLREFYARRFRRLLPAATAVILFCVAAALLFAPSAQRNTFALDTSSAAAFLSNWRFAERSVDYLAEGIGPSPVLHFWSLSIEEQFYFIWPLLIIVSGVLFARRIGARWGFAIMLTMIAVPSALYSLFHTGSNPQYAFFNTGTRLWELAIGAFVAIMFPFLARLSERLRRVMGVTGLGLVAYAVFFFDGNTPWPSLYAAVPVLGTAAIIAAASPPGTVTRLLSLKPAVWIGGISYSLYLWHWPLLVVAGWVFGDLTTLQKIAIVCIAVLPAWLSLKFLENPIRTSPRLVASTSLSWIVGLGLVATGVTAGAAVAVINAPPPPSAPVEAEVPDSSVSEPVEVPPLDVRLDASPIDTVGGAKVADIYPPASAVASDVPDTYDEGCQVDREATEPKVCIRGASNATVKIAVLGDSKANQWSSALDAIGKSRGWQFDIITKSGCPFTEGRAVGWYDHENEMYPEYETCTEFNADVMQVVNTNHYDAVITSNVTSYGLDAAGERSVEAGAKGLAEAWTTLEDSNIDVIAILDNPYPTEEVPPYQCVDDNPDNYATVCAFDRDKGYEKSGAPAQDMAATLEPRAIVVNMNPAICSEVCEPVSGSTMIYRTGSHLTDSFVRSLTPELTRLLDTALGLALDNEPGRR